MMTDWWTMTRRPEIAALQKVANDFSDTSFKSFPFLLILCLLQNILKISNSSGYINHPSATVVSLS